MLSCSWSLIFGTPVAYFSPTSRCLTLVFIIMVFLGQSSAWRSPSLSRLFILTTAEIHDYCMAISAESVPCLHLFQKSLWQSMACSLMGHHAEVQYQCKSSSHHWAALWQGYKCSPDEWQHRRMVQNNSRSKARMSSVTHPLQHFSRTDHVWCPGRT